MFSVKCIKQLVTKIKKKQKHIIFKQFTCANGSKVTEVNVEEENYSEILRLFLWARHGRKTDVILVELFAFSNELLLCQLLSSKVIMTFTKLFSYLFFAKSCSIVFRILSSKNRQKLGWKTKILNDKALFLCIMKLFHKAPCKSINLLNT